MPFCNSSSKSVFPECICPGSVTPLAALGTDLCGVLTAVLGLGDAYTTALGLAARPSVVLFSPYSHESSCLLWAQQKASMGPPFPQCCAAHRSCSIHELQPGGFSGDFCCPEMDFSNVESSISSTVWRLEGIY